MIIVFHLPFIIYLLFAIVNQYLKPQEKYIEKLPRFIPNRALPRDFRFRRWVRIPPRDSQVLFL